MSTSAKLAQDDSLFPAVKEKQPENEGDGSVPCEAADKPITSQSIITVAVYCLVNLITYMDRFSVAGVLEAIQCDFAISDSLGGFLQTAPVILFILTAPVFGYLGDRRSRKLLIAFGLAIWSLFAIIASLMTSYWPFLVMRTISIIGDASYSSIAPTIIADLFAGDRRSKFLAVFFLTTPIGAGLGYLTGSNVRIATGSWQWGVRVIPIAGIAVIFLILLFTVDPPRGESEGFSQRTLTPTTLRDDMKYLVKNKTYVLMTISGMASAFFLGGAAWWAPKFLTLGFKLQSNSTISPDNVPVIFGLIAMLDGLIGVPLGSYISQRLRIRYPKADPLICGINMLLSVPFLLMGVLTANTNGGVCLAGLVLGNLLINFNWAIGADIVLYTIVPNRRSTARAMQSVIFQLVGDAAAPYLIGQISDSIKNLLSSDDPVNTTRPILEKKDNYTSVASQLKEINCTHADLSGEATDAGFYSLQYAFLTSGIFLLIGAACCIADVWYVVEEKAKVSRAESVSTEGTDVAGDHQQKSMNGKAIPSNELTVYQVAAAPFDIDNQLPGSVVHTNPMSTANKKLHSLTHTL